MTGNADGASNEMSGVLKGDRLEVSGRCRGIFQTMPAPECFS